MFYIYIIYETIWYNKNNLPGNFWNKNRRSYNNNIMYKIWNISYVYIYVSRDLKVNFVNYIVFITTKIYSEMEKIIKL